MKKRKILGSILIEKKRKQKEEIDLLLKVNLKLNITSINRMVSVVIKCNFVNLIYSQGIPLLEIRMSSSLLVIYNLSLMSLKHRNGNLKASK